MESNHPKVKESDVRQALTTLERLEAVTRRLQKEKILVDARSNTVLQTMLLMALGRERYFVHPSLDLSRCSSQLTFKRSWKAFLTLTEKLASRNLSGKKAGKTVDVFLHECDPTVAKWYFRILEHNLEVGVSRKTAIALWGKDFFQKGRDSTATHSAKQGKGTAFTFRGCMLGLQKSKLPKKHANLSFPCGGEYKLDGERFLCVAWPAKDRVQIVSRENNRKYHIEQCGPFCDQVLAVAEKLGGTEPIFLDGEFLAEGWNKTSSVVSSTKNFDEEEFLRTTAAILFDWAPLKAYQAGVFRMPWLKRKNYLLATLVDSPPKESDLQPGFYVVSPNIAVLGHVVLQSEDDLLDLYDQSLQAGFEGLMRKQLEASATYDNHRGPEVVKYKAEEAKTGVIVKCLPGKSRSNAAVPKELYAKAKRWLAKHGKVVDDKYYLRTDLSKLSQAKAKALEKEFKTYMKDAVATRVWLTPSHELTYRHSARLGRFLVKCEGQLFKVGTGFKIKNGSDERMKFWRRRKKLIGVKIDFKHQKDPNPVAAMRFNSFVRIREDL